MLVTKDNFAPVMDLLDQQPRLIHDTETTGLNRWHDDVICGHAIATPRLGKEVFYFPIRHKFGNNLTGTHRIHLNALLSQPDVTYTGFNYKYDIEMGLKEGIPIPKKAEDTMLSYHLLDENEESFKLKDLGTKYIDPEASTKEREMRAALADLGLGGKGQLWEAPPEIAEPYACQDVVLTEQSRHLCLEGLRDWSIGHIWQEVNRYMLATVRMEQRGLVLDQDLVYKYSEEADAETQSAYAVMAEIAGYDINPRSHPQMSAFLGMKSTKREFLEEIREGNPIIDSVIAYRAWDRANSAYYHPYLRHVDPNGILHANLNLNGTVSGRPSASNPNMQAVPRYTHIYKIKDVFLARPGFLLVSCDYSQAELRLGSLYGNEIKMMDLLNAGGDIHAAVAAELLVDRDVAKRINFGVFYGVGAAKLARTLRIRFADAHRFLEIYHDRYRQIRPFYRMMQLLAQYQDYIRLWTGRLRHYNRSWSQRHKALSNFIQGGVSEMMRHAILRLDPDVQLEHFHMNLQVHDQILFEVPIETAHEVIPHIKYEMENFPQFARCPPKVDVSVGKRWGKMEKWVPGKRYKVKAKTQNFSLN